MKTQPHPLQFDLFAPILTDFQLRDQREIMERPFFSLAKTPRFTPIEYVGADGVSFVKVEPGPSGMPTIWDADILIWAASQLTRLKNQKVNHIPRTLRFVPHELLLSIHRDTGGAQYERLRNALQRLKTATVTTNVRSAKTTKKHVFSWIESWKDEINNQTALSHGMEITVSDWFYEGVLMDGAVLTINPDYFTLKGGRERWLYRVCRKHAGGAGAKGFSMNFTTLFDKSGAEGTFRRFKYEILKIVQNNNLPDLLLCVDNREGPDPMLNFKFREKRKPAQPFLAATQSIDPATLSLIGLKFPSLDPAVLQPGFDAWLASQKRPQNYSSAFFDYCRAYHDENNP